MILSCTEALTVNDLLSHRMTIASPSLAQLRVLCSSTGYLPSPTRQKPGKRSPPTKFDSLISWGPPSLRRHVHVFQDSLLERKQNHK